MPADAYDAMAASANWVADPPVGGICHIAADGADGMVNVVSVWRSVQASINFAVERVAVVGAQLGIELGIDGNPPSLAIAHAVYSPPTVDVTA